MSRSITACWQGAYIFTLLFSLLLPLTTQAAKTVLIEVSEIGGDREEAEWYAINSAIDDAFEQHFKGMAFDDDVQTKLKALVTSSQKKRYRPLVKRWLLSVDEATPAGYQLEGKVVLRKAVLKQWVDKIVCQFCKKSQSRLSIYLPYPALDRGSWQRDYLGLLGALKQQLTESNFEIIRENNRAQAQYRLKASQLKFASEGLKNTLSFDVDILDNRSSGELLTTVNGYAVAAQLVTKEAVKNELFKRAAEKIHAGLNYKLLKVDIKDFIEVVFYAPNSVSKNGSKRTLEQELAKLYGYRGRQQKDTFLDNINAQPTEMGDQYAFSFLIPKSYSIEHRELEQGLQDIQNFVFGSDNPDMKWAAAGSKIQVFDQADRPPHIEVH